MKIRMRMPLTMVAAMVCTAAALGLAACRAGDAQAESVHPRPAGELPGDQLVQKFGGRPPRPCPAIKHPPSDEEAAILIQCGMEGPYADEETFLTDVKVHVTGSRPWQISVQYDDRKLEDVDPAAKVVLITGYAKTYTCGSQSSNPGANCVMQEMPDATGSCWRTHYGEYRCNMWNSGKGWNPRVPPPTHF